MATPPTRSRAELLQDLKRRVQDGTYRVDPQAVAASILSRASVRWILQLGAPDTASDQRHG